MKRALLMVSTLIQLSTLSALAADNGSIKVKVTGLNNDKGVVRIALFKDKDSYKADDGSGDKAFQRAAVKIASSEASHTFSDIPYGSYAIKLFHDESNSGKFLTNAFGIPRVQYGFSNNARGRFGPAAFEKALFDVKQPETSMTIAAK
ncbi:MAG: DUF2141 domain-containing protein [Cyanobacteria bacterium HKST-UBA02]|nr:DUF2141 domain-containing protein [Cyanobacteria bacterium HKST-UBA02]